MLCLYHIELQQYQKGKKKEKERQIHEILMNCFVIAQYMVMWGQAKIKSLDLYFPSEYAQGALHYSRVAVQLLPIISLRYHASTDF